MTSPRHRELTRTMNIRIFILMLAFFCFWVPLMYFWAWNLEPFNLALSFALLIGGGCGLCLLPYWRDYGRKIDRLLKYSVLFGPFFEAMIGEMEANDSEKGDSWKTIDFGELLQLMKKKQTLILDEFGPAPLTTDLDEELAKLGNYCAMVYLRHMESLK